MNTDEIENELRNLKLVHLTDAEMSAYCDQQLDPMRQARMDAHLGQCFICRRHLARLREEDAELSDRVIAAEDAAFVEKLMEQMGAAQKTSAVSPAKTAAPLKERLAEYLGQMVASWQVCFGQAVRGVHKGEEVWRWQSEDGRVQARAIMEKNADLTLLISSTDMSLEGARFNFRMGQLSQEMIMQRVSESEVEAKVSIPSRYRRGKTADISIESV